MTTINIKNLSMEEKVNGVFVNGNEQDGEYMRWYANGNIAEHCYYKDGRLHGSYKEFDDKGKLYEQCAYSNGIKHGDYKGFDENGNLVEHHLYRDGKFIEDCLA